MDEEESMEGKLVPRIDLKEGEHPVFSVAKSSLRHQLQD